jgi:transmembrane protein EpsG
MIAVLIINIIAVLFAGLQSAGIYRHGLKLSLFIVFLFLALRYDFGNDYMAYLEIFQNINSYRVFRPDLIEYEFGWLLLNRIFGSFGFFAMNVVLAAFSCYVLFTFIERYVPHQYYWFAVFLYVFQPSHMLILSSAMRQAIAVSLFLLAINFIIKKKVLAYLLLILIAALFHHSALLLFPLILLGFVNWHIKFIHTLTITIVFMIPFFFLKEVLHHINYFTTQFFEQYSSYVPQEFSEVNVGLGFALRILIYLIVIYHSEYEINEENKLLFKIVIISILMTPLGLAVQLISRLNLYVLPAYMAVFPFIFIKLKKAEIKLLFIVIIILLTLYDFHVFFQSDIFREHYKEYHTIFSAKTFY